MLMGDLVPDEPWRTCGENRGPARPQTATTTAAESRQPTPPPVHAIPTGARRIDINRGNISSPVVELGRLRAPIVSRAPRRASAVSAPNQREVASTLCAATKNTANCRSSMQHMNETASNRLSTTIDGPPCRGGDNPRPARRTGDQRGAEPAEFGGWGQVFPRQQCLAVPRSGNNHL